MAPVKVPVLLTVLSGRFDTQPEAFAYLLHEAGRYGLAFDLADVDVIQSARPVRMAHYFRPAIVGRIEAAVMPEDTLIILRPSPLTARRDFPGSGSELRLVGRFAGEIVDTERGEVER